MEKTLLREVKIKTGVLKRNHKDYHSYKEEAKKQEAKIADMRDKGADEYDIKKQEEGLTETMNMLPDCKSRIQKALDDLQALYEDIGENEEFKATEECSTGEGLMAEVRDFLASL